MRGFHRATWRRVQARDCILVDLHRVILAAFGFDGERNFRFSRDLPEYLDTERRFKTLPPEMWISQLAALDGTEVVLRHRFGEVNHLPI